MGRRGESTEYPGIGHSFCHGEVFICMNILITEEQLKNVLNLVKEDNFNRPKDWRDDYTEKELYKFKRLWDAVKTGIINVPEVSPYKFRYRLNGGYRIVRNEYGNFPNTQKYFLYSVKYPDVPKFDLYAIDGDTETNLTNRNTISQDEINDLVKVLMMADKHVARTLKSFGITYRPN